MKNTTAPAKRDLNQLLEKVDQAKTQLAAYLPPGQSADQFMALARRAIAEQPELAKCNTGSVLRALSGCATSGLPLDGQFSSLIIRKSKNGPPTATWDPTYRGMISMAMSSGFVSDVQSSAVTEHDEFSVELGTSPKVNHVPALLTGGRIIAAYAWARLTSGRIVIEILTRADIDQIKKSSPAGERGPWGKWESQMARKSAVRRLLKKLPASPVQALMGNASRVAGAPAAIEQMTPEALTPEFENQLECQALERIRNSDSLADLQAAYAQCQVEYSQAGADLSASVRNAYQAACDEIQDLTTDENSEWIDEFNNG